MPLGCGVAKKSYPVGPCKECGGSFDGSLPEWEYRIAADPTDDDMDHLGRHGWEAFAVCQGPSLSSDRFFARHVFFKRQING